MRKVHYLIALALGAGAMTASAMGCELIASVDRSAIGQGGEGGGQGGAGGQGGDATTTTTTGGGMGGAGGAGGQGGGCTSDCANGEACTDGTACTSGNCVDGVCCDTLCDGVCAACDLAGSAGTCSMVPDNEDPDDECADEGAMTCGADGMCDGSGACRLYAAATLCGDVQSCMAGLETGADTCDGAGNCIDGGSSMCSPYTCDVLTCKTSCTVDTDCVSTHFCNMMNQCVVKKGSGQNCMGNGQCNSGFCIDGVCCDGACGATCQACNVVGSVGTCTSTPVGSTDAMCMGTMACDGAGMCKSANGETCTMGTECASGNCVDGVCCNTSCVGDCQACDNAGMAGTCSNVTQGTVEANCSAPQNVCNNMGQCKLGSGASCALDTDCASGSCSMAGFCTNP